MKVFSSPAAVHEAIDHYALRPSKTTGRPLSPGTGRRVHKLMTDAAAEVFCSGLTGNELMWALDRALANEKPTYRSIGLVMLAQFANYYGLLETKEYKWWCMECNARYKPQVPISEKILPREVLKDFFDPFASMHDGYYHDARLYCYTALLLLSGARHTAILDLKPSDISITENVCTITIRRLKSANTAPQIIHIPMDVPLPNGRPVGEAIYGYITLRPDDAKMFFCGVNGEHSGGLSMSMRHQLERHSLRYCTKRITPHMFRFTCASIISDHVGVKQAQQLLGHTQMNTTLRYAGHFYDNVSSKTIASGFYGYTNHKDESFV